MNSIIHLLFETVWFPGVFGAVGFVVLLFAARNMEPRRRGRFWVGWMVATVVLLLLSTIVVTDRERLRKDLEGLARCVVEKNNQQLAGYIATEFQVESMDRHAFLAYAANRLKSVTVDMPWFSRCDMTIEGDAAVMELTALGAVQVDGFTGHARSDWTVHWRRSLDGWRVTAITPRRLNTREVSQFDQLHP